MSEEQMDGGCACGRVRFRANIANDEAYLCHCRMCQRATGSISIAFKNVKAADVTWESEPDWYESSPIARRPFCAGYLYTNCEKLCAADWTAFKRIPLRRLLDPL